MLQVAGAHVTTVETELLSVFEEFDALIETLARVRGVEGHEVDEADALDRA